MLDAALRDFPGNVDALEYLRPGAGAPNSYVGYRTEAVL
jgi:hypothetical protein